MNKPRQPLYYAVPLDEGTMVFAAWSFTQALETKKKLRAEYSEAHYRDRMFTMYEITSEEFDRRLVQATAIRTLDNGLVSFIYPVPKNHRSHAKRHSASFIVFPDRWRVLANSMLCLLGYSPV